MDEQFHLTRVSTILLQSHEAAIHVTWFFNYLHNVFFEHVDGSYFVSNLFNIYPNMNLVDISIYI